MTGVERSSPICSYVAERTGCLLSVQQVARLSTVLASTLSRCSEEEYLSHLKTIQGAAELAELMSVIAVHKTDLFRDEIQLKAFGQHILDPLVRQANRPLHFWSAGCSTG